MAAHPPQAPSASAASAGDAGAQAREVEWQLAATDLSLIRDWLGRNSVLDGLRISPLPTQQLHDTYLDTEDWRVFRAGYALRLREREGQVEATLKGLRSAREDVADRTELTEPLTKGGVQALARAAGSVGSRVRDVVGGRPLRRLFEVRTSRERFAVRSDDTAADVGELALDEARFSGANAHRPPMILTRVELEAVGPDCAALEGLAARLRAECGLQRATENKFAAGLHSASLEPPRAGDPAPEAEPVPAAAMRPATRAGDFAAAILRRLISEWRAREAAARLGESPEALHALRVTGRRMDTVLSLFRACLPTALGRSQAKVKSLLDALGTVRDVDIRLEAAKAFRSALPAADREALDPLLHHLQSQRHEARAAMLRALDAEPIRHWLERLPAQLSRPRPAGALPSARDAAALDLVPDLIRKRYRRLRKCARRLTPESPMSRFHEVRVRTKKLRYALEVVAPTYTRPADEMLDALLKLQSRLGTQHDADVIARYLTQLAAEPPAEFRPATLFLLGRLTELHARKAARMGARIEKPWRKVRGRRWKALRARMKELRRDLPKGNGMNGGTERRGEADDKLAGAAGRSPSAASGS